MATFKSRVIRKESGEVIVKTVSSFSADEAANIERIADDENVKFETLRTDNYDIYFAYMRILFFWADVWVSKEKHSKMIIESIERKKAKQKRMAERKQKRRKRR